MDRPQVDPAGVSAANQLRGEGGRPGGTRTRIARVRGGSPVLLRGQGEKLVGETGFAPARAFAHEFLRLACIHSTTRRKMLVRPGRLARPRVARDAAVFKTARSTVPRTAASKMVAAAGVAPARAFPPSGV